jgi:Zn-dependent protease with chaperone function
LLESLNDGCVFLASCVLFIVLATALPLPPLTSRHCPLGLASALGKLGAAAERIPLNASPQTAHLFMVNPLSGRSLTQLFSTHPPLEERIARLRAMAGQRA